ncbi:MAG: lysylphosphatidylglycerol synthase transmembrane domain-containing protein [Bacteroidales bacterium]
MNKLLLNASKIIFFLGLGVFFIWLFMHTLTPDEKKDIFASFKGANYSWLLVSVFIGILSHASRTIRWMLLLAPMGYTPRFKNTFLAVMIGYFANLALPRMGEVTRCGILARYEKIPLQKSFGTVVTERGLDLIILTLLFVANFFIHLDKLNLFRKSKIYQKVIASYNQIENPGVIYWITAICVLLIVFALFKYRKRISHTRIYQKLKEILLGFAEGLKSLLKIKNPYWFIFHSFFIWFCYLLMGQVVFYSLPETSHLGLDVGLSVLVFGSIGIIIIQGGIGIYPWIVAEILILFFIPSTKGYAMGWLIWTGQTLMIISAGVVSMILLPIINNPKKNEPSGNR